MTPSRPPFFDPQLDAESIAYWRFSTAVVADRLLECANRAQEVIRHRVRLGVFYGYVLELRAESRLRCESHLDYERVFSSPDLDFSVSPTSYQGRQPGGADGVMMLVDSLRLRGKQASLELDHRTYLVNDPSKAINPGRGAIWKGHKNETETIGVLRRGLSSCLAAGRSPRHRPDSSPIRCQQCPPTCTSYNRQATARTSDWAARSHLAGQADFSPNAHLTRKED